MIPVLRPDFDTQTKKELLEVLDSGWVGQGPKTFEFEKKFAEYVGAKYCIMTNSGTTALDLAIKVYGLKGGELITTPMTFVSDAIVGEWNDMDVTFCDIEEESLCLDPKELVINPETKVIIPVDCHGRLANLDAIRQKLHLQGRDDILIIEDAAHAMFTPGVGRGDITVWSFQAVKSLPIFDGGAITTNNEAVYKKLRTLTWLGVEKSTYERAEGKKYTWDYDITQSQGVKGYMTDVQAVLGLGQLRRLPELLKRRQEIQAKYNEAFDGQSWFKKPMYSETVQYYTPQWDRRDELSEFLATKGIATSVHFKPLHCMTYWAKAKKNPLPITDKVWPNLLSLPVFYTLKDEEVDYIIKSVFEFYAHPTDGR